jgi:hypothetical protein
MQARDGSFMSALQSFDFCPASAIARGFATSRPHFGDVHGRRMLHAQSSVAAAGEPEDLHLLSDFAAWRASLFYA